MGDDEGYWKEFKSKFKKYIKSGDRRLDELQDYAEKEVKEIKIADYVDILIDMDDDEKEEWIIRIESAINK